MCFVILGVSLRCIYYVLCGLLMHEICVVSVLDSEYVCIGWWRLLFSIHLAINRVTIVGSYKSIISVVDDDSAGSFTLSIPDAVTTDVDIGTVWIPYSVSWIMFCHYKYIFEHGLKLLFSIRSLFKCYSFPTVGLSLILQKVLCYNNSKRSAMFFLTLCL